MFEMFQLPFMVQAFSAAVITGILLSYLGVHVVGRGIVFVDLALGQISSLGVAFAAFIGTGLTSIPLIFKLFGGVFMSFINIKDGSLRFRYTGSALWKYLISKLGADNIYWNCIRRNSTGPNNFLQEIF